MVRIKTFLVIMTLLLLFFTITSAPAAVKLYTEKPNELSKVNSGDIEEGEYYEGDVDLVMDVIAEMETTHKSHGITTSKDVTPYYLVMLNESYAIVHVSNDDLIEQMNDLMDDTWDFLDGNTEELPKPIHIQTKAVETESELQPYIYDYFEEAGYSKEECDDIVEDSVLQTQVYKNVKKIPLITGAAFIVLAVITILVFVKSGRKF